MNGNERGNAAGHENPTPGQPAPLRLLVIDDESGVLRALTLVLQTMSVTVEACGRPEEALEKLAAGLDVDGILCDLRMPKLTGLQVLGAVRERYAELPFVLMSGHANSSDVAEARRLGVTAFLPKPFMPAQLANELGKVRANIEERRAKVA